MHSELWEVDEISDFDSDNIAHLRWLLASIMKDLLDTIIAELASTGDKTKSLAKWKFDLSNEIQDLAYATGLKIMIDGNLNSIKGLKNEVTKVVNDSLRISIQDMIIKRLLIRSMKFVSGKDLDKLSKNMSANVKKIENAIEGIVDAFGVPKAIIEMIPAASDYVDYNQHNYKGEVKEWVLRKRAKL